MISPPTVQSFNGGSTVIRLGIDPNEWKGLPTPAKHARRDLRRVSEEAWGAWRAVADERQSCWDTKAAIEAQLKMFTGARADSPYYSHTQHARFQKLRDDDARVAALIEKLKDVVAELARLNVIVDERSRRSQECGQLVTAVDQYLNECHVVSFKMHNGPDPRPQKRENATDAVERCRRRNRELVADRHRVTCSPWHSSGAKERARVEIEALAERGRPSVLPLIEDIEGSVAWGERAFTDTRLGDRMFSSAGDPPVMPLLFWLSKDALIARLDAEIDAVADDAQSLTLAQRTEQISQIDRDRLAVQRDEEYWLCKAIEGGMNVLRRADADPRAVLGLSDEMPAPKTS